MAWKSPEENKGSKVSSNPAGAQTPTGLPGVVPVSTYSCEPACAHLPEAGDDFARIAAGELHAVLCRGWKNRVKGRDFYDFVWYVGRGIAPNLEHLEARMRQSGHWDGGEITR